MMQFMLERAARRPHRTAAPHRRSDVAVPSGDPASSRVGRPPGGRASCAQSPKNSLVRSRVARLAYTGRRRRRQRGASSRPQTGRVSGEHAEGSLTSRPPRTCRRCRTCSRPVRGIPGGFKSAQARRLWHDGALSAAVAALEGSGASGRRQQARLAGELAVSKGRRQRWPGANTARFPAGSSIY